MQSIDFSKSKWISTTYGKLSIDTLIDKLVLFMQQDTKSEYSIIIGTDSTGVNNKETNYITAILVHRKGNGGIYFWHKFSEKINSFYERIFNEASLSLQLTELFLNRLKERNINNFTFEIHVDVGNNGKTREIISQVVGMIIGSGHKVVTKPYSYAASKVADRHT